MTSVQKLSPRLSFVTDEGFKVSLVTDGRMSGAPGKVPTAIQVSPEALAGGPIARLQDGDMLRLDADTGQLAVLAPVDWENRTPVPVDIGSHQTGFGRELFASFRLHADPAE